MKPRPMIFRIISTVYNPVNIKSMISSVGLGSEYGSSIDITTELITITPTEMLSNMGELMMAADMK